MNRTIAAAVTLLLLVPSFAAAYPFGGQASQVLPCYNNAILAYVGPPKGGAFVWTPATRTYRFGAPTHSGQWLLGLAGISYFCIVSIVPLDVRSGDAMTMMGSSQ
jgi:hypothetical protein